MADTPILVANERHKAVSNALFTLGAGLFAAAVVKAYGDKSLGLEVGGWFLIAVVLILVGWLVLGLLVAEP